MVRDNKGQGRVPGMLTFRVQGGEEKLVKTRAAMRQEGNERVRGSGSQMNRTQRKRE